MPGYVPPNRRKGFVAKSGGAAGGPPPDPQKDYGRAPPPTSSDPDSSPRLAGLRDASAPDLMVTSRVSPGLSGAAYSSSPPRAGGGGGMMGGSRDAQSHGSFQGRSFGAAEDQRKQRQLGAEAKRRETLGVELEHAEGMVYVNEATGRHSYYQVGELVLVVVVVVQVVQVVLVVLVVLVLVVVVLVVLPELLPLLMAGAAADNNARTASGGGRS